MINHYARAGTDELIALLSSVPANPGEWLQTPNQQLGNRKPIELIGTPEESKVVDILKAVDHGLF